MKKCLCLAAFVLWAAVSYAQISLTTLTYSQNFDSLATSASNNTANAWSNNSTLPGWFLFNAAGAAPTTYGSGSGDSNAGAFYSFGVPSATERALGGAASGGTYFGSPAAGTVAGYIAVAFTNNTGSELGSFTLNFDGEQWRNGGNTSAQTMVLQYGFGTAFSSVTTWTTPGGGFDFVSPVIGATGAAVVGNTTGSVPNLGGTVMATWAPTETLWIRWVENNDFGNDHGLAIDNFSFTATPSSIPEPSTYAALFGSLALLGVLIQRRRRV